VIIGTVSTAIGFAILSKASPFIISIVISTEAFEEGGSKIGLAAMAGFAIAFILGRLGGG
jgi:hypothetical protein